MSVSAQQEGRSPLRILIISHFYPPLNQVGTNRVYAWAKYWSRAGHDVTVLTTRKSPIDGSLTFATGAGDAARIALCETEYLPAFLARPVSNRPAPGRGMASGKGSGVVPLLRSLNRAINRVTGAFPNLYDLWIRPGADAARKLHALHGFDVVVSSCGPPACHMIASLLKRSSPGLFWVADYRDLWAGNHIYRAKWPFSSVERAVEDMTVRSADLMTTVSDTLAAELRSRFGDRVITIENGFDEEEDALAPPERAFPDDGVLRIAYTGRYIPERMDVSPLFEALRRMLDADAALPGRLELVMYGNDLRNIPDMIHSYGLDRIVRLGGLLDRAGLATVRRDADGFLLLDYAAGDGVLSVKLLEYLAAGKPILCSGGDLDTEAAALVRSSGAGVVAGKSVEAHVDWLMRLLRREPVASPAPPDVLRRFSRRELAARMLHEIFARVGQRPAGRVERI